MPCTLTPLRLAPAAAPPDAVPVEELVGELGARPPEALAGAAAILNHERSRRALLSSARELVWEGEPLALRCADPGARGMELTLASEDGRVVLDAAFDAGCDLGALYHPLAQLLPVAGDDHCLVATRTCPGARFEHLDPRLVGPRIAGLPGRHEALMTHLGRVIDSGAGDDALGRRYVEPGVGRTYLVDFVRIRGRPELADFSVTGAGLTPFAQDGFFFRGPHVDGRMPMIRALHRLRLSRLLEEAGCRVPAVAAIVSAPELRHTMPDGTRLPGALMVRGFRTVLRVKQLDPLANLLMSAGAWDPLQRLLERGEWSVDARLRGGQAAGGAPPAREATCTCLIPSFFLGTRPGRRCQAGAACRRQRMAVMELYAPALLDLACARLSEELGRDPETECVSREEYATWFAEAMAGQLAAMRSVRFLHDYRAAQTEWDDPYDLLNSLTDTNVTLLAELADLDTGVLVDRGEYEWLEALRISYDGWEALRAGYEELHAGEVRIARGIAETVALAAGCARAGAARAFEDAYRRASARRAVPFGAGVPEVDP